MPASPALFEADDRGLVRSCPQCGQLNRLTYERLGHAFRCPKCRTQLPAPAEPVEIPDAATFDSIIRHSPLPVLVDFWAPWCGPCRMVAPELEKVAAKGAGQWMIVKINTEQMPEVGARFQVRAIPTMALFRGGREVSRQAGAMGAPAIEQFIRQAG